MKPLRNEFKVNWEDTRIRFRKWWEFQTLDRPILILRAPKPGWEEGFRSIASTSYVDHEIGRKDFEGYLQRYLTNFSRIAYLAEAFPSLSVNLGPGAFGVYLGAKPLFTENSVWYEEKYASFEAVELSLKDGKEWLDFTLTSLRRAKEVSGGRFLLAFPDLVENLDTLAALFGTANLLIALIEHPSEIHTLQKQALTLWFEVFESMYPIIADEEGWSCYTIFDIWGPGTTAKLQCDIAAMLSPAMFDEFVLPYLTEQCLRITSPIFHLDGPDAVVHLPSILRIPSLRCVQWTPGAGKPDAGDPCWWDLIYRRVLDAGKSIHATMKAENVVPFVKHFGGTGVFVKTMVDSYREGEELLEKINSIREGGIWRS